LVAAAQEIAEADALISATAGAELDAIARQIRGLREQAAHVLERARNDARLHRAECRFRRRPGQRCHLYERPDGSLYFSLLSPADWNHAPPHQHQGSYLLESDMRWTPLELVEQRERERGQIRKLLSEGALGE
jgi:hypothetical protein